MFLVFVCVGVAVESGLSLIPPLVTTGVGEIGNWTLVGSSVNMKRLIRLTPNIEDSVGFVCLRVPTFTRDWTVDFEVSVHSGNPSGEGLFISFTSEVCPSGPVEIRGFSILMNTSEIGADGRSPVYYQSSNNPPKLVGRVRLYWPEVWVVPMKLSRSEKSVRLDVAQELVFEETDMELIDYGYFTIAAQTDEDHASSHDLLSWRFTPIARPGEKISAPDSGVDWGSVERDVIDKQKRERREGKEQRRREMPITRDILNKLNRLDKQLDGSDTGLMAALKIIKEAATRAADGVSGPALREFIETNVDLAIESANSKLSAASTSIVQIREEINALWSNLQTRLLEIGTEATQQMMKIDTDFEKLMQDLKIGHFDAILASRQLTSKAQSVDNSTATLVLTIVALVELIADIIFFLVRRRTTHGFKKYD